MHSLPLFIQHLYADITIDKLQVSIAMVLGPQIR